MRNLILVLLISSSSVWAKETYSQETHLNVKSGTLESVFEHIRQQSGYEFFYNNDLLDVKQQVAVSKKNGTLEEVLNEVLGDRYTWEIKDRYVMISEKRIQPRMLPAEPVIVKGSVVDKQGSPLPGVSVLIKGTNVGVATDVNGEFTLNAAKMDNMVLVFSFIGMKPKEVKYTGQNSLKVVLEEDVAEMDEVVVTGYQTIKKTRMTGAVDVVNAQDIANKGFATVEDVLKGTLAGVTTMSISGRPGAEAQIRIRGINSLTGNSDPIWIVDGMPLQGDLPSVGTGGTDLQNTVLTSGIGNLSPDDIKSITILKDAAATAIYGSRAANGVIVVETKRGTAGQSYINIQSTYSIDEAPESKLKMMNTQEKIAFERGIYEDFPQYTAKGRVTQLLRDADAGRLTHAQAEAEIQRLSQINTNWYDEIFRLAQSHNHNISLSGGTEQTQYYASLNYMNQQGVMPNNKYDKFGASLRLTHDFNKRLRVNFDLSNSVRNDRTSASSIDPLYYATYANPYETPYDANGNYAYDRSYAPDLSGVKDGYKYDLNVLEDLNANTSNTRYVSNQVSLKAEYQLIKGLMYSLSGTLANTTSHTKKELSPGTYSSKLNAWAGGFYAEKELPDYMNRGSLEERTARSQSWTVRNQLEFARSFNDTHHVSAILGQEASAVQNNAFSNYSAEYDPDKSIIGFPDATGILGQKLDLNKLGSTSESQDKSASFFFSGSYSYLDKYIFAGSYRLDGADIIGTSNRFSPLWNVSGKWNLQNEGFMADVKWVSVLSLRGTYGFTGSIDRNAYPFTLLKYGNSSYRYNGVMVPSVITPANPSVKWQKKKERSAGVDFSLFGNRLNGTVNYYNNITGDLLDNKKVAMSSGRDQIKANVASLKNSGWEISLSTVNVDYRDFRWTTTFNIALNKSRVLETYYKSIDELPNSLSGGNYFVQDKPVQSWFGYEFAGVDPYTGNSLAYVDAFGKDGNRLGHLQADGRYVADMDQRSCYEAKTYLGEAYPPITGGFGTTFNYKRFSLGSQFTFMTGHKIQSYRSYSDASVSASRLNQITTELNRWRKPGDVTMVPRYDTQATAYDKTFFDFKVEDGSFLKCTYISFGYNMSPKLCRTLLLTRARFNFNVHNVFTSTKYRGIDPETMGAFGYPSARRYIFTLSLGI